MHYQTSYLVIGFETRACIYAKKILNQLNYPQPPEWNFFLSQNLKMKPVIPKKKKKPTSFTKYRIGAVLSKWMSQEESFSELGEQNLIKKLSFSLVDNHC